LGIFTIRRAELD